MTLSAGGNDLIRPGGDPDALAEKLDSVVHILSLGGATVVLFDGPDTASSVLGRLRSKIAIYNENLRTVAARHDAVIADMWSLRQLSDPQMWDQDRLHFSPLGHHTIAAMVLDSLNIHHTLEPLSPKPLPQRTGARRGPAIWCGRANTSFRGLSAGCATNRRGTASPPKGPHRVRFSVPACRWVQARSRTRARTEVGPGWTPTTSSG